MDIIIKGFIIPHNEEPYYTCADRYAINPNTKSIAIADGVGGSLYPSFLSERITKDFVAEPVGFFDGTTHSLKKDYNSEFQSYYQKRYDELPSKQQQILDLKTEQTKASSCTFVGCWIDGNRLKYYAIGDSYLFFIANDGTTTKISSMDGKEFGCLPDYLSTDGKHKGDVITGDFPLQNGTLLMMTDALSDWFIKYYSEDNSLLDRILELKNHKEYTDFLNNELASGRLHDDDCAMIIAQIENEKNPKVKLSIKHLDNITELIEKDLKNLVQEKDLEIDNLKSKLNEPGEINPKKEEIKNNDSFVLKEINNLEELILKLGEKYDRNILPAPELENIKNILNEINQNILNETNVNKEIKDGIDRLLQFFIEKKDPDSESSPSENGGESKKKLNNIVGQNINLLLEIIIILLIALIFVFK